MPALVILRILPCGDPPVGVLGIPLHRIASFGILTVLCIICVRSSQMLWKAKPSEVGVQTLFYESLLGQQSQIFRSPIPILIFVFLPLSLWYIFAAVYYNWEWEFGVIITGLQFYPALLWGVQSVTQGTLPSVV